ncbi:MAG: YdeI/OmpD-associated family protein [Candidatus Kapaibacterium sp.]|nr:YdeI/OmpD-associated family protein [Candidatus Kapabacteria bacterium]
MKTYNFDTILMKTDDLNGTYIEFPYDAFECFGKKGQIKVYVNVNGYEYRSSLVKMGHHCHLVVFRKEHRIATGLSVGDKIHVNIREDKDIRDVEIPSDVKEALEVFPDIDDFFHNMSYSHRKEYVEWINSAKKEETRIRRIIKGIETLTKMYEEKKIKKNRRKTKE